jgi:hypothetical protein
MTTIGTLKMGSRIGGSDSGCGVTGHALCRAEIGLGGSKNKLSEEDARRIPAAHDGVQTENKREDVAVLPFAPCAGFPRSTPAIFGFAASHRPTSVTSPRLPELKKPPASDAAR